MKKAELAIPITNRLRRLNPVAGGYEPQQARHEVAVLRLGNADKSQVSKALYTKYHFCFLLLHDSAKASPNHAKGRYVSWEPWRIL